MWTDVLACAAHNHVDSVLGPLLKSLIALPAILKDANCWDK